MSMAITQGVLSASDHSKQLRKAVVASTIGTAIEWYDFFLYGTAAGLIFGKLYFPNEDPLTATLAAFGTYFIGFLGRPIGAAIFGHYGDRIGRKATLIATLLCMGIATFLIAFVPTYASIGIWGAVILTVLRMFQGIGVGGEWGGSVLLAMEWSRTHGQRGLVASWPQFGVPCGLFLSNLAVLVFSQLTGDQFYTWGWRVPFALSIILVGVGLWIRLGILETPVFQQLLDNKKIEKTPIVEVFRKHPKEIMLSALVRMSEQAPFYIFTAFIFAYAVGTLKMSRDLILTAVLAAACVSFITIPLSGHISDRIGRRKMYLIGAATVGVFGFLYFGMVDTADAGPGVHRNRVVADPARHAIWPAGGLDRGGLYAAIALQRCFARLSARLGDCRRSRAAHRDRAFRQLPLRLCDFVLHRGLCGHKPRRGVRSCPITPARTFRPSMMTDPKGPLASLTAPPASRLASRARPRCRHHQRQAGRPACRWRHRPGGPVLRRHR